MKGRVRLSSLCDPHEIDTLAMMSRSLPSHPDPLPATHVPLDGKEYLRLVIQERRYMPCVHTEQAVIAAPREQSTETSAVSAVDLGSDFDEQWWQIWQVKWNRWRDYLQVSTQTVLEYGEGNRTLNQPTIANTVSPEASILRFWSRTCWL